MNLLIKFFYGLNLLSFYLSFIDTNCGDYSNKDFLSDKLMSSSCYRAFGIAQCQSELVTVAVFKKYPELKKTLPYTSLGNFPTPIDSVESLAREHRVLKFYIKRDDLTGRVNNSGRRFFGGNKVRKLEFILADALHTMRHVPDQFKSVLTFGCVGSNHALATATYARGLGLDCYSMLKDQWNSRVLQRNIMLHFKTGSKLYISAHDAERNTQTDNVIRNHSEACGFSPYIIPTGGSSSLGVIGYVNAAFELKDQINHGLIDEPNTIYVALGSGGTFVGLVLGCKAAGLKSRIVGVKVEPEADRDEYLNYIKKLYRDANALLTSLDPSFAFYEIPDLDILYGFEGEDYALFTQDGVDMIDLIKKHANITLDGVYSAKAMHGMIESIKNTQSHNSVVMFWNTFCSQDFVQDLTGIDYRELPQRLWKYFEEPLQPLDI